MFDPIKRIVFYQWYLYRLPTSPPETLRPGPNIIGICFIIRQLPCPPIVASYSLTFFVIVVQTVSFFLGNLVRVICKHDRYERCWTWFLKFIRGVILWKIISVQIVSISDQPLLRNKAKWIWSKNKEYQKMIRVQTHLNNSLWRTCPIFYLVENMRDVTFL